MNPLHRAALFLISVCLMTGLFACAPALDSRPEAVSAEPAATPSWHPPDSGVGPGPAHGQPVLVGKVLTIADGDTIKVELDSGPITVRLDSIDAPEKNQPWGRDAYAALYQRLHLQVVALDVREQDRYERLVAVVYLGNENINAWLVQQGHAWAYRRYLRDEAYCDWEASARSMHRGLWSLPTEDWVAPWEWRRSQRGDTRAYSDHSQESAELCRAAIRRHRSNP